MNSFDSILEEIRERASKAESKAIANRNNNSDEEQLCDTVIAVSESAVDVPRLVKALELARKHIRELAASQALAKSSDDRLASILKP